MNDTTPQRVVCVLGPHRSGTSLVTKAVNILGVELGSPEQLLRPAEDNPLGFFEHAEIVALHDELLSILERSWSSPNMLPDKWWTSEDAQRIKQQLEQIVNRDFANCAIWGFKDPRTCLTLPLWQEIWQQRGLEVSYVIVSRHPVDVAKSMVKRNRFSLNHSLAVWYLYTISMLRWTIGAHRAFVEYDSMIDDWEGSMRQLAAGLGISWPEDDSNLRATFSHFVRKDLRHSNVTLETTAKVEMPSLISELHAAITNEFSGNISSAERTTQDEQYRTWYQSYANYAQLIGAEQFTAHRMQLFYTTKPEEAFCEAQSHSITATESTDTTNIDIPLGNGRFERLRLDPTEQRAFIHIHSIDLVSRRDNGRLGVVQRWDAANGYEYLHVSGDAVRLNLPSELQVIATGVDPQIYLNLKEPLIGNDVLLRIRGYVTNIPVLAANRLIEMNTHSHFNQTS